MRDTLPLLGSDFPAIKRTKLDTLQVNLGYRCNQSCVHCHVNAGPTRTEEMTMETAEAVIEFMGVSGVAILDITGGAPELNGPFRTLVAAATERGVKVIDRCNLTILEEPGYEDLAEFLAHHQVRIVASLPCYLEENVNAQRGKGVFGTSIDGLKRLNRLGYGHDPALELDLVFNPQGAVLPPEQSTLEQRYKLELETRYGVVFNHLLTMTNMPVGRFGSILASKGTLDGYIDVLKDAHKDENINAVMCRSLVNVDWEGYVYDCDFNQMLGLPLRYNGHHKAHLRDLMGVDLDGAPIVVRNHCYGCTAGSGSSCGGALA